MIVLDEQLLGRELDTEIVRWYEGAVCFITDMRPNTVVKDDAIPGLLQSQNQPTFVTINETDFWRKVVINDRFCVVCFALPDSDSRNPRSLTYIAPTFGFQNEEKPHGEGDSGHRPRHLILRF